MTVDHGGPGWLVITTEQRQHGGNDGYSDDPEATYRWDDTVPNHASLHIGDTIVLWDKVELIGASAIESIVVTPGTHKSRHRCPNCGQTKIKPRSTVTPIYRCHECRHEFDIPATETIRVTEYAAHYPAGWTDLRGAAGGDELRSICARPRSQHSMRRIDVAAFTRLLAARGHATDLAMVDATRRAITGGHRTIRVRARIGQGRFREQLLERYGELCAFTGPAPKQALQACHLYSYALTGKHHPEGGLLIRADLHTLFDRGLIRVHPRTSKLAVADTLQRYPHYAAMDGTNVHVALSDEQRRWLQHHWDQHDAARTEGSHRR